MKPTTAAWLATSAAIIACIVFTHRIAPLWFFVLPFLYSFFDMLPMKQKEEKPGMEAFKNNG